MKNQSVLVVVAHPDDEVLGCGGSIAKHNARGDTVSVLFMSDGVMSRNLTLVDKAVDLRRKSAESACHLLGVSKTIFLNHPDNQLDQVPMLQLIKGIESVLQELQPTIIYTHHSSDLNIDHICTHNAVVTACRPQPICSVQRLLFFEIPSSTEWRPANSRSSFVPQWFSDISGYLPLKLKALSEYSEEIRLRILFSVSRS